MLKDDTCINLFLGIGYNDRTLALTAFLYSSALDSVNDPDDEKVIPKYMYKLF